MLKGADLDRPVEAVPRQTAKPVRRCVLNTALSESAGAKPGKADWRNPAEAPPYSRAE